MKLRASWRSTGSCHRRNERSDILPFTMPMGICESVGRTEVPERHPQAPHAYSCKCGRWRPTDRVHAYLAHRCFADQVRPELRLDPEPRTARRRVAVRKPHPLLQQTRTQVAATARTRVSTCRGSARPTRGGPSARTHTLRRGSRPASFEHAVGFLSPAPAAAAVAR